MALRFSVYSARQDAASLIYARRRFMPYAIVCFRLLLHVSSRLPL